MHRILHVCLSIFRTLSVAAQVTATSFRIVVAQGSKKIEPIKLTAIVAISALALNRVLADDIQPLGDEFGNAATFNRYQEHGALEGWGANHVESADINTSTPGHFRIVPSTTGWYEHLRGTHFSKNVTGDFIVTAHIFVYSRRNPGGPLLPSIRLYSLGGILIREPRAITHAAPSPYTTNAVWPPQNFGSDWTPGDENWANTSELVGKGENYIFLSLGTAGNSGTRQFEIKDTRRSRSELYYSSNGIGGSNEAWLQIIRVGNTVVCLRKHSAAGPWIVENRYPNADHAFPQFGPTLQVGMTAYTDFNSVVAYEAGGPTTQFHANYINIPGQPDLILDVDYMRIQRPPAALTEAVLQAMAVSYNPATNQTANPPVLLSASPVAAPLVGDNANVPLGLVVPAAGTPATEGQSVDVVVTRSGASLDRALSMTYQTVAGSAGAADFTPVSGTLAWAPGDPAGKTITIPLTSDALAEGSETFTLQLSDLDGPATFPASDPSLSVALTILDHPFDQWRIAQFAADANSPSAASDADYDSDGVENLLEHVFQTDPINDMDAAILPESIIEDDRFGLRFVCPLSPGVRLEIQQSTSLDSWQVVANRPAGAGVWTLENPNFLSISGPSAGEIRVLAPAGVAPMFLRLSATQN